MSELLQDQIAGLKARLEALGKLRDQYQRAAGLEKEAAKAGEELVALLEKQRAAKEHHSTLEKARNAATDKVLGAMRARMNEGLPASMGQFFLDMGDKTIEFGIEVEGRKRPYRALSGGEKISFEIALAMAFGCGIITKEAAELDSDRFMDQLELLDSAAPNIQAIVATCHPPKSVPPGERWTICAL